MCVELCPSFWVYTFLQNNKWVVIHQLITDVDIRYMTVLVGRAGFRLRRPISGERGSRRTKQRSRRGERSRANVERDMAPHRMEWPFQPRQGPVKPIVGADSVGAETLFLLVRGDGQRLSFFAQRPVPRPIFSKSANKSVCVFPCTYETAHRSTPRGFVSLISPRCPT